MGMEVHGGGSRGVYLHTECPPLLRSQLAALLTDVLQRTDAQDRGGI